MKKIKNIIIHKKNIKIFLALTLAIFLILFLILRDNIKASLNGEESIEINVGEKYEDLGFTLKNKNKKIDKNKYIVEVSNNVDVNKLGNYEVIYNINYKKVKIELKRNVIVVDKEEPVLTVNLETVEKDYCTKQIISNLEYSAIDNYDKDITDKIIVEEKENKLIIKVEDSSKNLTKKELEIKETEKPANKFYLVGNNRVYTRINENYNDEGAKYEDGCGKDLSDKISKSGEVNTSNTGEYTITYSVDGEESLTRTVTVYEKPSEIYGEKIIYLTFDDGPGASTQSILNTLAKHNVKATFFVTNQFPGYSDLIKSEYDAGHKIAVHTYSHNYNVYSSVDTYINDFNRMNDLIKEKTGSYSRLFRFPGGSSNTVSRNYSIGVVSQIANRMTNDGYIYFDWNVDSTDAEGSNSNTIYNRVVNGVSSCHECVVLMHDIKQPTADALDSIISTLKERGYTFATLNENSNTAHHGINN